MTYRQTFDHLGNPIAQPEPADWQHKLIQRAAWTTAAICAAMLIWLR